jgi:hypothetical protein
MIPADTLGWSPLIFTRAEGKEDGKYDRSMTAARRRRVVWKNARFNLEIDGAGAAVACRQ